MRSRLDRPPGMDVSRVVSEGYKVWILCGGVGLVAMWRFLPRKAAVGALALLTLLATLNYARWGPRLVAEQVDTYDLVHYYLNAKYFDELGYYDLYPAAIYADLENDGPYFRKMGTKYMAQNEAGHGFRDIEHAYERGKLVAETKFTPETWAQFEHDVLVLQREIKGFNDKLWRQMIQDHGFNGTLPWTMVAEPLTHVVPVESVKLLCYIDLVLLLGGVGVVGWAYGSPAALWAWFFLMVSYSVRWPIITGAYLRYDWVAALLVGMSLVKKGHHLWAGVATGYAATIRLFPAMWLYGPGMKGLYGLLEGKVHKKLLVLLGGFLLGVAALQGASMAVYGAEPAKVHFENMLDHNSSEQLSSRRIGLALALPYRGELEPKFIEPERKDLIEAQKPLRYGLALGMMLLLGWGLRKADDDETYAFGFVPFFLLTTASYYYYVARITLMVLHASDLKKDRNQIGLAMLVGIELFANWAETRHPGHRVFLIGWMAWLLTAYVLVMMGYFWWEARQPAADATGKTGGTDKAETDQPTLEASALGS